MHHKRGRPKNARSGCLYCKPNKMNGYNPDSLKATGGKHGSARGARNAIYSTSDLKEVFNG